MTKYTNTTKELVYVEFEDGSSSYLMAGQSIETDKPTKWVHPGIDIVESVEQSKVVSKKTKNYSIK